MANSEGQTVIYQAQVVHVYRQQNQFETMLSMFLVNPKNSTFVVFHCPYTNFVLLFCTNVQLDKTKFKVWYFGKLIKM